MHMHVHPNVNVHVCHQHKPPPTTRMHMRITPASHSSPHRSPLPLSSCRVFIRVVDAHHAPPPTLTRAAGPTGDPAASRGGVCAGVGHPPRGAAAWLSGRLVWRAAQIVLVNLLIAQMSDTYQEVSAKGKERWMFERAQVCVRMRVQIARAGLLFCEPQDLVTTPALALTLTP